MVAVTKTVKTQKMGQVVVVRKVFCFIRMAEHVLVCKQYHTTGSQPISIEMVSSDGENYHLT